MTETKAETGPQDGLGGGSDSGWWAVDGSRVKIWEDAFHVLHLSCAGQEYEDVHPRQVFPVSSRSSFVSFFTEKSEEVVLLEDPEQLDGDSRGVLDRALHRLYYAAVITRVYSITETMGVSMWTVMTDRGYATFEVVDRERHIRLLPNGRFLITDADGNRFEIVNVAALDERSQRLVETET
ncbi:MAG: DUF1854 domain-containing protein [Lentisphaeria bacterium]|nr:DUF1854 domain-containing protein [Lentisphaeria bacterium]